MQELVKPGGILICIVYPIDGDREGGPPFSVDKKAYETAIGVGWEKLIDKVPADEAENDLGRKRLVIWKRK